MKRLYSILFVLINLLTLYSENKKENEIRLNLSGKTYDHIILRIITDSNRYWNTNGILIDGDWIFTYPDSIYEKHRYMSFIIPEKNDSIIHLLSFNIVTELNDSLQIGNFTFQKKQTKIKALFYQSELKEKMPFFRFKDFLNDVFIIAKEEDSDLYVMAQAMHEGYSMFSRSRDTLDLTYNERLQKYIDFTKKYPDSHYLISQLASTLSFYNTKNDIKMIFNSFSEENKQSYFGKKIDKYLKNNYFENSVLPAWDTHELEPLVKDTTNHTLVIFSASWCGPCHKQIPLLKELYKDMHEKMDIVYVSIDDNQTIEEWTKLMRKENIPWRSVMAVGKINEVKDKYTAQTIPRTIWVKPDGKMKIIDIKEKTQRDELYKEIINK